VKKLVFYISNTLICSIFLVIRFIHFLFEGDNSSLTSTQHNLVIFITVVLILLLLLNIYLSFCESNK